MRDIDKKKTKLELMRVTTAKAELEFRIEERLDEISRIQDQIKIQDDKINEIQKLLDQQ